jgi:hypothetical protein
MMMPSSTSLCSTGIEHRKQPGGDDAGADRGQRAAIQRADPVRGADLGQIARKRCDHQHGFEPLAEPEMDGGLDECGGHRTNPVFWLVLSSGTDACNDKH